MLIVYVYSIKAQRFHFFWAGVEQQINNDRWKIDKLIEDYNYGKDMDAWMNQIIKDLKNMDN